MKRTLAVFAFLFLMATLSSQAAIFVRISTLTSSTLIKPANPVAVAGTVVSESPLKITDGSGEITITGLTAPLGDFLSVTGNWDGSYLIRTDSKDYTGPASTEMIYIPAGSFLMGNSGIGRDAEFNISIELPQHSVTLSGYYIGKYSVTRGEYAKFINAGGYSTQSYWSTAGWSWKVSNGTTKPYYWTANQDWGTGTFTQTDSHPVVGVSYYECEAYCKWAGGRLPTEAEWEKAARWTGSHANVYPWGDTWDKEKCNIYYDSNPAGGGYGKYQTSPVGSYPSGASPYGCQDMAGNVWEWCTDWCKSYPGSSSPFDYTNSYRVLRGGCWYYYGNFNYYNSLRCAYRGCGDPSDSYRYFYGFRLARSAP